MTYTLEFKDLEDFHEYTDTFSYFRETEMEIALYLVKKYGHEEARKRTTSTPFNANVFTDLKGKLVMFNDGTWHKVIEYYDVHESSSKVLILDDLTEAFVYSSTGHAKQHGRYIYDIKDPNQKVSR